MCVYLINNCFFSPMLSLRDLPGLISCCLTLSEFISIIVNLIAVISALIWAGKVCEMVSRLPHGRLLGIITPAIEFIQRIIFYELNMCHDISSQVEGSNCHRMRVTALSLTSAVTHWCQATVAFIKSKFLPKNVSINQVIASLKWHIKQQYQLNE